MAQVDAIFSKSRRWGYKETIQLWNQVGLDGDLGTNPSVSMAGTQPPAPMGFSRNMHSRTANFKDEVKEQPGSASVVQSVSEDQAGIGTAASAT